MSQSPDGKTIWEYVKKLPEVVVVQVFYAIRDWVRGHTHD